MRHGEVPQRAPFIEKANKRLQVLLAAENTSAPALLETQPQQTQPPFVKDWRSRSSREGEVDSAATIELNIRVSSTKSTETETAQTPSEQVIVTQANLYRSRRKPMAVFGRRHGRHAATRTA